MGLWSFYFLAKLLMFCAGFIGFHLWHNFAFALFTALPVRQRWVRVLKQVIAVPAGFGLLYFDSWLPPWQRIFAQGDQLSHFSLDYFLDLAQRFINLQLVLGLFLLLGLWWVLSRRIRVSTLAFVGILGSSWLGALAGVRTEATAAPATTPGASAAAALPSAQELDRQLDQFYQRERQRQVRFTTPAEDGKPYDILLLQICSLAWDDLEFVGLRHHPLLDRFNLRFQNFSAAASYSGPAAIRLLRSSCGQSAHEDLYKPADPACYLMDALQSVGFEQQWAMDHDGVFGAMNRDIIERGNVRVPQFPLAGYRPALRAFEGGEYYNDYEVLSGWWKQRIQSGAPRVALYFNSGYLHDGNTFLDGTKLNVGDSYHRRAQALFDDIGRFMKDIEASGRRAVVIVVPEHGANVRGDRLQISGLREIPTPGISLVPVGVNLVGGDRPVTTAPLALDAPSSHLALSSLLASFTAANPFVAGAPALADYAAKLPQTEFVSENDGAVVMRAAGRYWLRGADRRWSEYISDR